MAYIEERTPYWSPMYNQAYSNFIYRGASFESFGLHQAWTPFNNYTRPYFSIFKRNDFGLGFNFSITIKNKEVPFDNKVIICVPQNYSLSSLLSITGSHEGITLRNPNPTQTQPLPNTLEEVFII